MQSEVGSLPTHVEELLERLERETSRFFSEPVHDPAEEFTRADLAMTAQMLVDRTRAEPALAQSAAWMTTLQMFADLYQSEEYADEPSVPLPRSGT